jgi:SPP1 family predicted phage head-tail adaptor
MRTDTGQRRNYITIQTATRTADGQGGWTVAWANAYNDWARAIPLSMSRTLDQGGISYKMAVEFEIRKDNAYTLTAAHRIVWNSENYTIHSVIPSEKLDNIKVLAYV